MDNDPVSADRLNLAVELRRKSSRDSTPRDFVRLVEGRAAVIEHNHEKWDALDRDLKRDFEARVRRYERDQGNKP